ncbi:hypothetical protein HDA32_005881 [Spinactinospora alkalitolerans]|uniref:Uncharacterized protein n=1 Tax=Spinactinospora alkalitolerans TaxID=687207 RepID=A0A852U3K3_9ACTN|nr:hypothetical protein [Spinactinospora alkalitolerans]NYE50761.1 hypothetical protein [Spinactinospora alkalitolerans]
MSDSLNRRMPPPAAEFARPVEGPSVYAPLRGLLDDPRTEALLRERVPRLFDHPGSWTWPAVSPRSSSPP